MKDYKGEIKYPTLKDVANLAGVSPITVSRVYNNKWGGRIKSETIKKVLEAARILGYSPNQIARSLNGEHTNIVAVVTGVKTGIFYDTLLNKLAQKIQNSGRQVLVFVADPSYGIEKIVEQVNQFRVDVIIVTSPALKSQIMDYFNNAKRPIILFNRSMKHHAASAVWSDSAKAMKDLVTFLIEHNLKKIAFVAGPTEGPTELERDYTFIRTLMEKNIYPTKVVSGDYTYDSGIFAAREIVTHNLETNVIVCSDDNMAFGVIDCLRNEFGINVPKDISVIGFDDNPVSRLQAYNLTTVRQPFDDMIDATIDIIEQVLEDPSKRIYRSFETELVIRASINL